MAILKKHDMVVCHCSEGHSSVGDNSSVADSVATSDNNCGVGNPNGEKRMTFELEILCINA